MSPFPFYSLYLFLFISLLPSATSVFDKVIETDIYFRNGYLILPIEIGTPPQWFNVLFDISSFHLFLANTTLKTSFPKTYNPHFSSSSTQSDSTIYQIIEQRGLDIQDYIGFIHQGPLSPNKKFHFILLNTSTKPITVKFNYDGVFGFAKKYPGKILNFRGFNNIEANPRFSLIQYMYVNNIIDTKSVGFKFISRNQARLTFGYYEGDYGDNIEYCDINNEEVPSHLEHYWLCKSKNIILGSNNTVVYENESYVIFDSTSEQMKLPVNIGNIFVKCIESAFPNVNNYKYGAGNMGIQVFYPKGQGFDINKVPDFMLTINDKLSLKITGKDLFSEAVTEINGKQVHGYKSMFLFGSSSVKDLFLGINFMKRYHIIFDKEFEKIGFGNYIGDDVLNKVIRGNWRRRRSWEWTHVVIGILALIIIGGALYMYRKKQLKKKYKKGLINKGNEKRANQEELIEPIGKPMVSVKSG